MRIGPYEVVRELGRGGMGVVLLAQDPALKRQVAIKVIEVAGAEEVARLHQEALAAARLRHPAIVAVHTVGVHEHRPYVVMDLVEGESLRARLARDGPLPPREAARLTALLARALVHAHALGVLHRDVKPANVLIDRRGDPVLIDFGLTRLLDSPSRLTEPGTLLGTPAYMSPEQAQGRPSGAAGDVYSLGATLYEMLTGAPPVRGRTLAEVLVAVLGQTPERPSRLRPDVPRELEAICLSCLAKDPGARFASAEALALALEGWLGGKPRPRPGVGVGLLAGALSGLLVGWAVWSDRAAAHAATDRRDLARAVQSLVRWRLADARAALDPVVERNPRDPHLRAARGWLLGACGPELLGGQDPLLERAAGDLMVAISIEPAVPSHRAGLARVQFQRSREQDAKREVEVLYNMHPPPPAIDLAMAQAVDAHLFLRAEDFLSSGAAATAALQLDPACDLACACEAVRKLDQRNFEEQEQLIEAALLHAPRDTRTWQGVKRFALLREEEATAALADRMIRRILANR